MKYFIANWKANKTLGESLLWINSFLSLIQEKEHITKLLSQKQFKIVICPPLPHLYPLQEKIKHIPYLSLGAQNISNIEKGTYTGETTALNVKGMVNYAIIGHSERRKNYLETQDMEVAKFNMATKNNIHVFFCISSLSDKLPQNVHFICWEPPESISKGDGMGEFKSLNDILNFRNQIPFQNFSFIYGGSVNEENVKEYVLSEKIDGFIIGGASLDPLRFFSLIEVALLA